MSNLDGGNNHFMSPDPIQAAGIMFLTKDGQALFMKRGNSGSNPGEWAWPGGKREDGEALEETAIRETLEESGRSVDPKDISLHTRQISNAEIGAGAASGQLPASAVNDLTLTEGLPPTEAVVVPGVGVDFSTYLCRVDGPFIPALCDEHTGWAWADLETPPEPLHPGCRIAIDRLTMDELGVARAMAAGQLTSPQIYYNMALFAIRITGTGVSLRTALDEFVMRDPAIYMTEEFLARCSGLPVILQHPKIALDSKEFRDRIVGTTFLPYLRPELGEVWAVVKIYDEDIIPAMASGEMSTSPCVLFPDPTVNRKFQIAGGPEDGKYFLFEGKPGVLDHIAVCENGVWDKGNGPSGIESAVEVMADAQGAPSGQKFRQVERQMILLNAQLSNRLSRANRT